MPQYDLRNICRMFEHSFKTILIALHEGRIDDAIDSCTESLKSVKRVEHRQMDERDLEKRE